MTSLKGVSQRSTSEPVRPSEGYQFGMPLQPREMYDGIDRLICAGYNVVGSMATDGWTICVSPCGGMYWCFVIATGHVYSFRKNVYKEG